jgi:hypothetical protein
MIITWEKDDSVNFTPQNDHEKGFLRVLSDKQNVNFELTAYDDPVAGPIITFTPVKEKV